MKGKYLPFTGREPVISNNAPDLILVLIFTHTRYVKHRPTKMSLSSFLGPLHAT